MRQQSLPSTHLDLATSFNNIGSVYYGTGEYSKALSLYEKALAIRQKSLPPNHPRLRQWIKNLEYIKGKL
jgi:tetratricopeptide (TPR) repeat protein